MVLCGPAPDTPCTMDSSDLGARRRRTRRNQYDVAGALARARRRNDVTRCNDIHMPSYAQHVQLWRHPQNRKYITYRNADRPEDRATAVV